MSNPNRFNDDVRAIIEFCGTYRGDIEGRGFSIELDELRRLFDEDDRVFVGWFTDTPSSVKAETPYEVWCKLWDEKEAMR